jgi:hypothetical protein
MVWRIAKEGELADMFKQGSDVGRERDSMPGIDCPFALLTLRHLARQRSGLKYRIEEEADIKRAGAGLVLHLAALISCGLSVRAFSWSIQTLSPVRVHFQGRQFLALAPISIADRIDGYRFTLVESRKYSYGNTLAQFVLLAWDLKLKSQTYILCLFPPDVDVNWKDPEENDTRIDVEKFM